MSGGGVAERPSPDAARALLERAREARERAYAPYSGFPVGAALLTASGSVVTGCNVENAAYPLSQCAERVALGAAVARGERELVAVAVTGPGSDPCWPCGSCRQALHELAPGLWVVTPDGGGGAGDEAGFEMVSLADLLPRAFELPGHRSPERLDPEASP
jgi:cytidine deaminase